MVAIVYLLRPFNGIRHLFMPDKDVLSAVTANRFHLLQESFDFLRSSNCDSKTVMKSRYIKIANENFAPLELLVQSSKILAFSPCHYKVGLGRIDLKAESFQSTRQLFTAALNSAHIARHPRHVLKRSRGRNQAQTV